MKEKNNLYKIMPVLFGFFVMGFCDVVGITSVHVKEDLLGAYSPEFRDTLSNLIPVALFSMFLFFSIPTGLLMNKIGRKRTVLISNFITIIAMVIPLIAYNFIMSLLAFALLGIANTMLQVSLNPLITNVISDKNKLTSTLTAGQFVKAISSFSAPFIAAFAASFFGNWQYIFPIYALVTLLSTVWLALTPIAEQISKDTPVSFTNAFGLLKDKTIFLLFLGILFVVGVDVGVNTVSAKLLMERAGLDSISAGYGPSVYFAFRTLGTFIGVILLSKIHNVKFYRLNILLALFALVLLTFLTNKFMLFALFGLIGFTIANIFPIIFSIALQRFPDKANELSGLMITGVFGGAVLPFFMGISTDILGSQTGSIFIIMLGVIYLTFIGFKVSDSTGKKE